MAICTRCAPSVYYSDCVDCGVRLVTSSRSQTDPKAARRLQEGHLAHIEHMAGAAVRDAVVAKLRTE